MVKIGQDFPASGVIKALEDANCYNGWEKEAIYFFYSYERHLCGEKGYNFPKVWWEKIWANSPQDSIEHIYPQTESIAWKGKVTRRREFHANRIGNLLILPIGLNKKLQNTGFEIKRKAYNETPMLATKEVVQFDDWNMTMIEKRTQTLLLWAQKEWDDIRL